MIIIKLLILVAICVAKSPKTSINSVNYTFFYNHQFPNQDGYCLTLHINSQGENQQFAQKLIQQRLAFVQNALKQAFQGQAKNYRIQQKSQAQLKNEKNVKLTQQVQILSANISALGFVIEKLKFNQNINIADISEERSNFDQNAQKILAQTLARQKAKFYCQKYFNLELDQFYKFEESKVQNTYNGQGGLQYDDALQILAEFERTKTPNYENQIYKCTIRCASPTIKVQVQKDLNESNQKITQKTNEQSNQNIVNQKTQDNDNSQL